MVSHNKTEQVILHFIFVLLCVVAVAPFVLLIASSLTEEAALMQYGYGFFPRKFSVYAYEYLFKSGGKIIRGLGITVGVTLFGTIIAVLITILFAYPLSRSKLTAYIEGGRVFVNGKLITSNGYRLKEGDIISVRKMGRIVYDGILSETKKGRYLAAVRRYL